MCILVTLLTDYFAQAVYHSEIAEGILRNHSLPNNQDAENERFYSMYVEMYHTLGRAYMVDKKYPFLKINFSLFRDFKLEHIQDFVS